MNMEWRLSWVLPRPIDSFGRFIYLFYYWTPFSSRRSTSKCLFWYPFFMTDQRAVNMLTVVLGLLLRAVIQGNVPHLISEESRKEHAAYNIFLAYTTITTLCMNMFSLQFGWSECCLWLKCIVFVFCYNNF